MNTEYNLIYLDTETTGLGEKDRLCQLAYKDSLGNREAAYFNPGMPIPPAASAVNHITSTHIEHAPAFKGSSTQAAIRYLLEQSGNVMVAHNAPFDIGMLRKEEVYVPRYICTQKLFKWLDNGVNRLESYSMQHLRYALGLEIEATAHDALGDITVLEHVCNEGLRLLSEKFPDESQAGLIEKAMEISVQPLLLATCPLRKHKGWPFRDVPKDYLRWVVRTGDFDADVLYTAKYYLQKA